MPDPTPGQVAYAAFLAAHDPALTGGAHGWAELPPATQRAWEAAAQAVLALQQEDPTMSDTPTPGALPCCRGDNVREVYYGWRCNVCDAFYAFGCEPWAPLDDAEEHDDA